MMLRSLPSLLIIALCVCSLQFVGCAKDDEEEQAYIETTTNSQPETAQPQLIASTTEESTMGSPETEPLPPQTPVKQTENVVTPSPAPEKQKAPTRNTLPREVIPAPEKGKVATPVLPATDAKAKTTTNTLTPRGVVKTTPAVVSPKSEPMKTEPAMRGGTVPLDIEKPKPLLLPNLAYRL